MAGALLVYVVDDNGLFGSPSSTKRGEDIVLTDEDLRDKISALLESGRYDPETDSIGDISSSAADYPAGMGQVTVTGGLADRLQIGSADSESRHGLSLAGGAEKTTLRAATGTLSKTYDVIRFAGKGASASFTLNLSQPAPKDAAEPVLLEIQEIHEAATQAFGYTVYVDGKAVYFRTYEQIASAPNHYFIAVERSAIADLSKVKVELRSESGRPFHIANVWAYTNFYELMEKEEVYTKLGINFYSAADTENALSTIKAYPSDYAMYDTGIMLSLKYMNLNRDEAAAALKSYVEAAEQAGTRLQIMSAMYWSNSPYSPDGLGGSFSDLKYSQVLYNSVLDKTMASTPNVYSSTQWVTTGSSVLNNAAVSKIKSFFSDFAASLSFLKARGRSTQPIDLVMEWGVCYKGVSTLTGYSEFGALDGADYHPELVAAAAKDGVTLDPKDGLSYAEKQWLIKWQGAYNQMLADAYREAMGSDAILVKGGEITMPETQSVDHIFTHNVQWINQNPSYDLTISGWQSGVGDGMYSSSEDMYFDPLRFYQYKAAYGRTGCVNLEMAIHNPKGVLQRYVKQSYAAGLEFVTLFNDKAEYNTAGNLREIDGIENQQADGPEHFDVNILDVDFTRDAAKNLLKNPPAGVSFENLSAKDGRLYQADKSKPASITLKLTDGGEAFDTGLYLDLAAIVGSSDTVELYGGESPDSLQKLGAGDLQLHNDRFDSTNHYRYDFTAASKGKNTYYVQLRLAAGSSTALRSVKVYRPFAQTAGQLNGAAFTMKQARLQSLWISQRAVTENQYQDYVEKNGGGDKITALADALMESGYYKTAYQLLAGEISQVLPAKYLVTGSGSLGKYPVTLSLNKDTDCVQIVLTKISTDECAFTFVTEKNQTVTLEFAGLNSKKKYELKELGDNRFTLAASDAGTLKPEGGKLKVEVGVAPEAAAKHGTVSGRAYSNGSGSTLKVTVQDPAVSNYSLYETYMMSSECVYTRRLDGSEQTTASAPRAGDYVTLTFNENNLVVKCEAVYGDKTGTIRSFTPPSVDAGGTNGVIEFTDGSRYELENQANTTTIQLDGSNVRARTKTPEQLAAIFTPGRTIRIVYCPESYQGALPRVLTVSDP